MTAQSLVIHVICTRHVGLYCLFTSQYFHLFKRIVNTLQLLAVPFIISYRSGNLSVQVSFSTVVVWLHVIGIG